MNSSSQLSVTKENLLAIKPWDDVEKIFTRLIESNQSAREKYELLLVIMRNVDLFFRIITNKKLGDKIIQFLQTQIMPALNEEERYALMSLQVKPLENSSRFCLWIAYFIAWQDEATIQKFLSFLAESKLSPSQVVTLLNFKMERGFVIGLVLAMEKEKVLPNYFHLLYVLIKSGIAIADIRALLEIKNEHGRSMADYGNRNRYKKFQQLLDALEKIQQRKQELLQRINQTFQELLECRYVGVDVVKKLKELEQAETTYFSLPMQEPKEKQAALGHTKLETSWAPVFDQISEDVVQAFMMRKHKVAHYVMQIYNQLVFVHDDIDAKSFKVSKFVIPTLHSGWVDGMPPEIKQIQGILKTVIMNDQVNNDQKAILEAYTRIIEILSKVKYPKANANGNYDSQTYVLFAETQQHLTTLGFDTEIMAIEKEGNTYFFPVPIAPTVRFFQPAEIPTAAPQLSDDPFDPPVTYGSWR